MGLPLRSPVAKLSCEAATEENAKRRSFMPRTQVTGKANFSPGITSGLLVIRAQSRKCQGGSHLRLIDIWDLLAVGRARLKSLPARYFASSHPPSGRRSPRPEDGCLILTRY